MRKVFTVLCFMAAISLCNDPVFAAVGNDEVTSIMLKEADGLTSQDTNTGSGVKTGHIQNAAVTTAKIAAGAVTTNKILDSAVTTTKIANGAVTDAKISGLISASKIESAGLNADTVDGQHASAFAAASHTQDMSTVTGLDAALAGKSDVTHNHDSLYQQKYGKVVVVAQTGGDYTDPVSAMDDYAAWCGTPSATNRCLVKIMPGIYTESFLLIRNYIDVEGSGENTTKLISRVVFEACFSEVRLITVQVEDPGYYAVLMRGGAKLTNVSLIARNLGKGIMMYMESDLPNILTNVTIDTDGIGIDAQSGEVQMDNVRITALTGISGSISVGTAGPRGNWKLRNVQVSAEVGVTLKCGNVQGCDTTIVSSEIIGGIYTATENIINTDNIIKIDHSTVKGTYALSANAGRIYAGNTKLDGVNVGAVTCAGVHDGNYVFYSNSCP